MRIRFITEGNMSTKGYTFSSNDENLIEQTVVDEIGEYLLSTFPKKFKRVDLIPEKDQIIPEVEVNTTPVTKTKTETKKKRRRPPKKKTETEPVKKN